MSKNDEYPVFMKHESVESLSKIHEKGYDYKQVKNKLNNATNKMLENSTELFGPRVISVAASSD